MQIKIENYIQKAEEFKRQSRVKPEEDTPKVSMASCSKSPEKDQTSKQDFANHTKNIEELVRKCSTTPQLKLGLEILQSAESYQQESQYKLALENYEKGLEIIISLLKTEPKGERKNLLKPQIERWMDKAEAVKELIRIQEKVLADSSPEIDNEKTCVLQ